MKGNFGVDLFYINLKQMSENHHRKKKRKIMLHESTLCRKAKIIFVPFVAMVRSHLPCRYAFRPAHFPLSSKKHEILLSIFLQTNYLLNV